MISDNAEAWIELPGGETLEIDGVCTFGRSSENQVVVDSLTASLFHATLQRQGRECWLIDLGGRNGTSLNNRPLNRPTPLQDGDVFEIGDLFYTFHQRRGVAGKKLLLPETALKPRSEDQWLLVADLANFTALGVKLPTDEVAAIVNPWLCACRDLIDAHNGMVNNYTGDGFLAHWRSSSTPVGKVAAAISALHALRHSFKAEFRLVIHHGPVSIGGLSAAGSQSLLGPTVTYAFRMEKIAGGLGLNLLFSLPARQLLDQHFLWEDVPGEHALKGFDQPQRFVTLQNDFEESTLAPAPVLARGGNLSLSQAAPELRALQLRIGWKVRSQEDAAITLFSGILALKRDGQVREMKDFVHPDHKLWENGVIRHLGVSKAHQDGHAEVITVQLDQMPSEIERIIVFVVISTANISDHCFEGVENAYIRVSNLPDQQLLVRYELDDDLGTATAVILGEVYRYRMEWKFRAVGQGFQGGLKSLARSFGLQL